MTLHFRVEREVLADAVGMVARVANQKLNIASTAGVRCVVEGDKLTLAATDLETSITTTISVAGFIEGEAVIPAKRLSGAVTALPDGAVEVSQVVDGDAVTLRCGRPSFTLPTYPAGEFPRIETPVGGVAVDGAAFRAALAAVLPAVRRDGKASALYDGVHVHGTTDGRTVLVATDSYRLHRVSIEGEWEAEPVTVPLAAMAQVAKFDAASIVVSPMASGNGVAFAAGDTLLSTTLIAGEYPAYQKMLELYVPTARLVADREALVAAVKRVGFATNEAGGVRFEIGASSMVLTGRADDGASATDEVEVSWDGADLTLGFNPHYLIDALSTVRTEEVEIGLLDALKPATVRAVDGDSSVVALVMSVKLHEAGHCGPWEMCSDGVCAALERWLHHETRPVGRPLPMSETEALIHG